MISKRLNAKDIEEKAKAVLVEHGLYSIPVDPVSLANKEGIKINNAVFSEDNLSGLIAKRGDNISILVNQSDSPYRKRFTIAHELGHHFLHLMKDGEFVDSTIDLFRENEGEGGLNNEVEANQFAAALLMPEELLRLEFKNSKGDIDYLINRFFVSETALMFRLKRLRLL